MQHMNVVLLQSDPKVAQTLAALLADSFHRVHVARSVEELHREAAKHHPSAIVLDLESAPVTEVETLKKEFEQVKVICNHRVADEEMWTQTLSAGAEDCCPSSDMRGILSATVRANQLRSMAAA